MPVPSIKITKPVSPSHEEILTAAAKAFLGELHTRFNSTREKLLKQRQERRSLLHRGGRLDFLSATAEVRSGAWQVAPPPKDLLNRQVEITGPVERKMMINALNSGALGFMADFEDSLSPTWQNVLDGQVNVAAAVRRKIDFTSSEGKHYALKDKTAALLIRPRGWHLNEKHFLVNDQPISGSLFDFGLCFFHNAKEQLGRGSGPYFYLPKMESHLEARLWNDVFCFAQEQMGVKRGSIRATVLIETIPAAFEMEEILFELREHSIGLNAGRWDYIFSVIKNFSNQADFILPDRSLVTMRVPFMQAYAELLVKTCHKRGAHAMGGMSAFVPSRKDAAVNAQAFKQVAADKEREVHLGFDGTWVAHPDLVAVAQSEFDKVLQGKPNQIVRQRADVTVNAKMLQDTKIPNGKITRAGIAININVAIQYLDYWLRGVGAAAIHNLMEDAATAEISRAQLWQWLHLEVTLKDGEKFTSVLYKKIRDEELGALTAATGEKYLQAAKLLDDLVLASEFKEFLTLEAYNQFD